MVQKQLSGLEQDCQAGKSSNRQAGKCWNFDISYLLRIIKESSKSFYLGY
jgi:hypothetical protein